MLIAASIVGMVLAVRSRLPGGLWRIVPIGGWSVMGKAGYCPLPFVVVNRVGIDGAVRW